MPVAIVIVLATLAALVVGSTFVIGAPLFAIPLVMVAISALGAMDMLKRVRGMREMKQFREQAKARKTEFTAEDKSTLA